MALQKDIEVNNTGVVASYWKITETDIDWFGKTADVAISGFLNADARHSGKKPLMVKHFHFSGASFPFTVGGNVLSEGYLAIKNYSETSPDGTVIYSIFKDAEDI